MHFAERRLRWRQTYRGNNRSYICLGFFGLIWCDLISRDEIISIDRCNAMQLQWAHACTSFAVIIPCMHCIAFAWPQYVRIYMRTYPWISCALECVSGIYCEWVSGASIVSLCCCQSLQQVHISMYMHVCLCLCFRTSAVCCYSSEP